MAVTTVFTNVLLMMFYLACGYLLVKTGKAESSHAKSISGFLIYACGPGMILSAFQAMTYDAASFRKMLLFVATTLLLQLLFFGILYLLLRRRYDDAQYRILSVGAVLANAGFFGTPIVGALFPDEPIVACYATLYILGMNLLVFTVGVFMITRDKRYMSLRAAVINPTVLTGLVAVPLYLLDFHVPDALGDVFSLLGKMTTPICMLVLGMRLASVSLKKVFLRPFAYITALLKLVVYPLFCYASVVFLPCFDDVFKTCVLILAACPSAAIILSMAELHDCEQELSANVVLMTTLLSVVTLPLLLLIV